MFGEIGSKKNRLRRWRINRKKHKEKRKKGKYVPFFAIPLVVLVNIIKSFIGKTNSDINKKQEKKIKNEIQEIQKEIIQLEQEINEKAKTCYWNKKSIEQTTKKVVEIKEQIKNINTTNHSDNLSISKQNLMNKVDEIHKKAIGTKPIIIDNTRIVKKQESKIDCVKQEPKVVPDKTIDIIQEREKIEKVEQLTYKRREETKDVAKESKKVKTNKIIPYTMVPIATTYQMVNPMKLPKQTKEKEIQNKYHHMNQKWFAKQEEKLKETELNEYIIKTTKKIEQTTSRLINIEQDLSWIESDKQRKKLLFEIEYIKEQLKRMEIEYKEQKNKGLLKQRLERLEDMDQYKLCKNDTIIRELKQKCVQIMENERTEKKKQKKEKEQLPTKEQKNKENNIKREKNQIQSLIQELSLMQEITKKQLKNQKKEIEQIQEKFKKSTRKKRSFFYHFKNFLTNTFQLTLSILPLTLFKNKVVGALTSAILINQTIKSTRELFNKKSTLYYDIDYIVSNIQNEMQCVEQTKILCFDSLEQINLLKREIKNHFNLIESNELEIMYQEIIQMENQIVEQLFQYETFEKISQKQKVYLKNWYQQK